MALSEVSAQGIVVVTVSFTSCLVSEVSTFCKFSAVRGILVPGGMHGLGNASSEDGQVQYELNAAVMMLCENSELLV